MSMYQYVQALSEELGINLTPNEFGSIILTMGEKNLLLHYKESIQSFLLYIEIGHIGSIRTEAIAMELLTANYLLEETQNATLSYNTSNKQVGLNLIIPIYGLEPAEFIKIVDNTLVLSNVWGKELKKINKKYMDQVYNVAQISKESSTQSQLNSNNVSTSLDMSFQYMKA